VRGLAKEVGDGGMQAARDEVMVAAAEVGDGKQEMECASSGVASGVGGENREDVFRWG
jgi:hypothetical protein